MVRVRVLEPLIVFLELFFLRLSVLLHVGLAITWLLSLLLLLLLTTINYLLDLLLLLNNWPLLDLLLPVASDNVAARRSGDLLDFDLLAGAACRLPGTGHLWV